jgi:diaminohydroxyphosphoribosylaminopyrimidine deaminase/5-amino-6-(5-phosphoribosylamino)uracil reductase
VDAIIGNGFARVVIGAIDPNPAHAGRGVEMLRAAGLDVVAGVLAGESRALNVAFNKWIVTGVPFVIAKAALSIDGRLTRPPGEGQWLSNAASRADAHRLRASVDAVLIGAGTLRADNPRLTVRGVRNARQPRRVIVAGRERLPKDANVFTDEHRARTLVYREKSLRAVLRDLGKRQITSVLIEGGGRVLGAAFDQRLVDGVHFYLAPLFCGGPDVIGGRGAASTSASVELKNARYLKIGDDLCLSADC